MISSDLKKLKLNDKFLFVYVKGMNVPLKGWFEGLTSFGLTVKDDRGIGYVPCDNILCVEIMTKEAVEVLKKTAQARQSIIRPGGK